ncbi:MAG: CDP-alcohol phosphatidyltransferase family protein [Acidimicrobiia bacterium]
MFTIPNLVSLLRLLLIPVLIWLLIGADQTAAAGWLLGFIGATDWVDGYLARRLDQVTELGKALDPIADRLAVAAALIFGMVADALPRWFAVAILIREGIMAVGAFYLWFKVRATLTVRTLGKASTFVLYMSIPAFFVGRGADVGWLQAVAWWLGVPGLILYYAVMVAYMGDIRARVGTR